ncbi:hypothetical protein BC829DRAFT_413626 [Chytridium lagenaria]|nr:hypothetical protein BC829DRAFT_413626 [Chytridium lagenaria]
MSSAESLKTLLSDKSFRFKFHDHATTSSAKEWVETVKANPPSGITDFALTKTLVIKPKGADAIPFLVIALEDSEFSIGALGKHLGAKESRAAADDLVISLFKVPRIDVSPFSLVNVADKASISVIVDSRLFAKATTHLGFRAFSASQSVFVSASNVRSFISGEGFEFKTVDFANLTAAAPATPAAGKAVKNSAAAKPKTAAPEEGTGKEVKIGIEVKKSEDFPTWYQQTLLRTEMMDYYDISGCYILRPWAFKIWKEIQVFFGGAIEDLGVEDCYFPMFVSQKALEREKDHIEGFAPEVAWVTKAGSSDLHEPVAVRPTSETVMYPAYAKWVQSHRDLPVRLNQWCNVVRWEFKNPLPFIRTREFLWQEGHTAFATKEEADTEVLQILDLYRRVYEELLAVPVVPGKKSENEKFAGGLYTTTVEGFVPSTGRGIQGATSHCLGQNFAKMFKIVIENDEGEKQFVWQNSWGLSTRTIGVMVMAVVVPTGITAKTTAEERKKIHQYAEDLVKTLKAAGVRVKGDFRENYTPGYKFNHWEMRGVPIRLEVGPKDIAKNETRAVFRLASVAPKQISLKTITKEVPELLTKIQKEMFDSAKKERDEHLIRLETWDGFVKALDGKNIILAPWCERVECEKDVKERSGRMAQGDGPVDDKAPSMGAKTLCIPFDQPKENPIKPGVTKCFACDHKAKSYALWGRSY